MFEKPLFGATISPSCEYCEFWPQSPAARLVFTVRKKGLCAKCPSAGITGMTLCAVCQSGAPKLPSFSPGRFCALTHSYLCFARSIRAMPPQPSSVSKSLPCVQKCLMALRRFGDFGHKCSFQKRFCAGTLVGPAFFSTHFSSPLGGKKLCLDFLFSFGHQPRKYSKMVHINERK